MKSRPVVPHCLLLDVIGTPRSSHGTLFVPALLEIDEPLTAGLWLKDYFPESLSKKSDHWTLRDRRAWSRIAQTFEFGPLVCFDDSDGRPPIDFAFVAIQQGSRASFLEGWPLACHSEYYDYETYGAADIRRLGLIFSRHGPPDDVKQAIAFAFWSLIATSEISEDVHQFGPMFDSAFNLPDVCVDCGGTGLEDEAVFRLGEPCETCGGTGFASWRAEQVDSRGVPLNDFREAELYGLYDFPEDHS